METLSHATVINYLRAYIYSLAFGCLGIGLFIAFSNVENVYQKRHNILSSGRIRRPGVSIPTYLLEETGHTQTLQETGKSYLDKNPMYLVSKPASNIHNSDRNMRTKVGFLKVHKAASTTTQSIFLRYGWKRNLTFVLAPEYNHFGYPNIISTYDPPNENNTLPPPHNKTFDILCHHVIYNKGQWDKLLPLRYSLIGTVREPWELFKSMLNYMNPWYIRNITSKDKVSIFLQNPLKFEPEDIQLSFTNNRMSTEFGVHPDIIKQRDFKAFEDYLKQIGNEFGVVIVAERFDESLVLLRRYLKWSLEDILYTSKNVRDKRSRPIRTIYRPRIEMLANFKNLSIFDFYLYDFFKRKLDEQILAEGLSFAKELVRYKEIRTLVETFCCRIPKTIPYITIRESEWNPEFRVTRDDCRLLHAGEIEFTQAIRKRQYGSATWTYTRRRKRRGKR